MPELAPTAWTLLAVGAMLVGIAKTALPGVATIAVATFAAVLPARASVGALLLLLIVGDLFALAAYRAHADTRVLLRLIPPVLAGVLLGTAFLAVADDAGVQRTIGVILLALVALTVAQRWRRRRSAQEPAASGRAARLGYGTLGGFTTMVANSGGAPMSLYFLTVTRSVQGFLGTAAWFFFVVNVGKVPFTVGLGIIDAQTLPVVAVLVPAVVAGAFLGRRLAKRLSFELFDKLVLVLTAASSVYLIVGA